MTENERSENQEKKTLDIGDQLVLSSFRKKFYTEFGALIFWMTGTGHTPDEISKKGGVVDQICLQIFQTISKTGQSTISRSMIYKEVIRLSNEKRNEKMVERKKRATKNNRTKPDLPSEPDHAEHTHKKVATVLAGLGITDAENS